MYTDRQLKNEMGNKVSRQVECGTRQLVKFGNNMTQRKLIPKKDNRQVKQLIDIETVVFVDQNAKSQLLPDAFIDRNNSVVSFVKVGSKLGHARILLEHVENNRFRNFQIELEANASSHSENDSSWMPSVISSGRLNDKPSKSIRSTSGDSAAGSEVEIIIKDLPNIIEPKEHEAFLISNATANGILVAAELLRQNQDILSYNVLVKEIDGFSMNCASFVELIAQSAGMNTVSATSVWGYKTPGGMLYNLKPH